MVKLKPINLEIAGIGCQIFAPHMVYYYPWQLILRRKYAPFLKEKVKPKLKIFFKSYGQIDQLGTVFKTSRDLGHASFDLKKKEAEISPFFNFTFFDFFFRHLFGLVLPSFNGFMLHASSVAKDGRGYIFAGESGSGKSTIIKLSKSFQPLADDSTIIRRVRKNFFVFASPFSEKEKIERKNSFFPLGGIYFLVKDKKNYLNKLSPNLVLEKLIVNVWPYLSNEFLKQAFPLLTQAAEKIPGYTLNFKKADTFWEVIDGN